MEDAIAGALERAEDADYWRMEVEFGADISMLDEGRFTLAARHFDTFVHFLPPGVEHTTWRLGTEGVGDDGEVLPLGEITVPVVIDIVPYAVEDWVLAITREVVEYLAEDEDDQRRQAGMRLRSEWEQGEAHSAQWKRKSEARYGPILLYDFAEDATLRFERGDEQGRPALFIGEAEHPSDRVLVAPDSEHPWRWSDPGHIDEYGERLTVQEAVVRAGADHSDWVREHTAYALGETLTALRAVQDEALTGRAPAALRDLARLAGHAQELAGGVETPPIDELSR